MSTNKIVFSSVKTLARNKNKETKLKKDNDGYYYICLGALNAYNSAGAYYKLEGAKDLFENSSHLMRRLNNGYVKAELGHPKKSPGMTMSEYMNRILTIDPENVCVHIKSMELVDSGKKDADSTDNLVYIMGWIKPHGPKAKFIEDVIEDDEANLAFSIRTLTRDKIINGVVTKTITQFITVDAVIEGGIQYASKWRTLGIESLDLIDIDIEDKDTMNTVVSDLKDISGVSTEDTKELLQNIEKVFDCNMDNSCIVHNW